MFVRRFVRGLPLWHTRRSAGRRKTLGLSVHVFRPRAVTGQRAGDSLWGGKFSAINTANFPKQQLPKVSIKGDKDRQWYALLLEIVVHNDANGITTRQRAYLRMTIDSQQALLLCALHGITCIKKSWSFTMIPTPVGDTE